MQQSRGGAHTRCLSAQTAQTGGPQTSGTHGRQCAAVLLSGSVRLHWPLHWHECSLARWQASSSTTQQIRSPAQRSPAAASICSSSCSCGPLLLGPGGSTSCSCAALCALPASAGQLTRVRLRGRLQQAPVACASRPLAALWPDASLPAGSLGRPLAARLPSQETACGPAPHAVSCRPRPHTRTAATVQLCCSVSRQARRQLAARGAAFHGNAAPPPPPSPHRSGLGTS